MAVVVPATNAPPTLERCLDAITAATEPPDELVVVSTPSSAGPAAARNAGSRQVEADVIVFVDSDVLVHPDAFSRIRRAFASDPDLAAVFGSYDREVATQGVVAGFRNLLHHSVHQRSAGHVRSFWAGLGAVRRSAFDAAGGFDASRYPGPSIEDIELGGRLASHGRILLDPAIQGTHLKEWTFGSMVRTDFARRGVPWVSLILERRQVPADFNLGARERASAAAALALAWGVVRGRPLVAAAGVGTGILLNRDLYSVLHARLGAKGTIAGIGLHAVHQLTAVAAVPAGVVVAVSAPATRR